MSYNAHRHYCKVYMQETSQTEINHTISKLALDIDMNETAWINVSHYSMLLNKCQM